MRTSVRGVALAALMTALLGGCDHRAPALGGGERHAGPVLRMVVLGDSLALGTGASDTAQGFAFRLFERVRAVRPQAEIRNFAIGGTRVADVQRLEVQRLVGLDCALVMIAVGGNDVVSRTPEAFFASRYRALLHDVHALAPRAKIVVFGIPDVSISPLFAGGQAGEIEHISAADDRAVRAIARDGGAEFVDLFAISQAARDDTRRFLSDDRFHPSDAGYETIAEAAWPSVARSLRLET